MTDRREALRRTLQRLAAEYADDPNVVTLGFGLPFRGDELKTDRAILFWVRRKYTTARQVEAAGSRPIPAEIDGFPTDVQEFRDRRAAGDRDEIAYDPLVGGVATSNAEGHIYWFNGIGTLGLLVRDATDGTPMALSNWHVWADGGDEGDDIIQPAHPTGGDHVEAVTKVAACGPLVTSLIEWEVPSPLTWGLYGGAAAAAIAAAASDLRDPTRRGQDQTPTNPGERTLDETVEMRIAYPQLPLPGVPFRAEAKWTYERRTTDRVLTHEVEETRVNTQFLLGKMVRTDRSSYGAGDTVRLSAAIWDWQPRPCDGYHVVAHLIPHARPGTALRAVLHPSTCPRTFPEQPPEQGALTCVVFDDWKVGEYGPTGTFAWLAYLSTAQAPVRVVDWFEPFHALQIPPQPLVLTHAPATRVVARVAQLTDTPVTLLAHNGAGTLVDQKTAPAEQGVVHELELRGDGIVRVTARGGGGEGLLLSYCIDAVGEEPITPGISGTVAAGVRLEQPATSIEGGRLQSRRCCFAGTVRLPPDEPPGKWNVHLTVQNVNNVPDGTPPDIAATTIGGHVLSAHGSSEFLGCLVVMLLDHAFDVI